MQFSFLGCECPRECSAGDGRESTLEFMSIVFYFHDFPDFQYVPITNFPKLLMKRGIPVGVLMLVR
jgi:hypothetical protein